MMQRSELLAVHFTTGFVVVYESKLLLNQNCFSFDDIDSYTVGNFLALFVPGEKKTLIWVA